MKKHYLILFSLIFLNSISVLSQNTETAYQKPDAIAYQHGNIVSHDGTKLLPEEISLLFESPDGYQQYLRTRNRRMFFTGVTISSVAAFFIVPVVANASLETEHPLDKHISVSLITGAISLCFCGIMAEAMHNRKMIQWVNTYNSMGIIPSHAEVSIGATPSGFGLCLNF